MLELVALAGDVAIKENQVGEVLELIELVGEVVEGDLVFGAEVVVDLEDALVGVGRGGGGEDEVATGAGKVGRRVVSEQGRHVAIEAIGGNDATGERIVCRDVTRLGSSSQGREVAAALGHCWDDPGVDGTLTETLVFLAGEEEEFGLIGVEFFRDVDRAAEIPAEVVEAEFLLLEGVEGASIKGIVANEFVGAAMEGS